MLPTFAPARVRSTTRSLQFPAIAGNNGACSVFWFHAAKDTFAERLVVLSEQRVKEREKIQCVVAVGQDVQGAREEEEACDVLAQGVEASQDHITHQRQRGNQRQNFGCKSSDGGTRIVGDSLLKLERVYSAVALGQYDFLYKGSDICQGHARLRNDAGKLIDIVGADAARCAQVMHPIVANAFRHSRDVSGWTPDDAHARG